MKTILTTLFLTICIISCKRKEEKTRIESEVIIINPDLKNMPSYADPKKYKILSTNGIFLVQLPHGLIESKEYETAEDAQIEINHRAKRSYDRWVKTGGLDY